MPTYRTTFRVEAPAATVWSVLTDFRSYGSWNPALPRIEGKLAEGERLGLTLGMPGRPSMNVEATIQELVPGRRFTWRGHLASPSVFAGHRILEIAPVGDDACDVTHVEEVTGALAPVFGLLMGSAAQKGHDAFNAGLAKRAETVDAN